MYQSRLNPNYYIPNMSKYWCLDCDKEFILSEGYDNTLVECPYCRSKEIQAVVMMDDPDDLAELGCMAIGFNKE